MQLDQDNVARTSLSGVGELVVDASLEGHPCMYVFIENEHPPVKFLLEGLRICDPSRLIGMAMNFASDEAGRVGFIVRLEPGQLFATALDMALVQILRALLKLQQS
ncbi:MAG: hypothetical protein LBS68_01895 [Puniceicoccales bacterium]|nr:hypothetical protein [Puniceicoccales bacterium]